MKLNSKVCCFSRNPDNYLLWSHYANGHRGFCVGFDFESITNTIDKIETIEYKNQIIFLKDVTYHPITPLVDVNNQREFSQKISIDVLSNKYHFWKYELEVRLIKQTIGNDYFYFPVETMKCVFSGLQAELSNVSVINELLNSDAPYWNGSG